MIKQNVKVLLKTLRISIPLCILLILDIYTVIRGFISYSMNGDVLFFLQILLYPCIFSFILLFYASYEFSYQFKFFNLTETLYSYKNGKIASEVSIFLCLLIVPLLQFIIDFLSNLCIYFLAGMSDLRYVLHFAGVLFLYIILGGIIPILLGIIFSKKLKRVAVYSLFALIVFLVSEISDFIFGSLSEATFINFWKIKYFFSYFIPNDLNSIVNYDYGLSCEVYRWNLTLFWIFFLFIIYILVSGYPKSKLKVGLTVFVVLIAGINLTGYFKGGSHIETGPQLDSNSMCDYVYYRNKNIKAEEKKPDFKVESYEMKLNISRELDVEVKINLSGAEIDEYDFTLYHDYKIKSITDGKNNKLEYTRNGDYITVKNVSGLSQIVFSYNGYSTVFYSNYQAVCLPGFFPYYPMAGKYDFVMNWGYYSPITDLEKSFFTITVNNGNLYSNLNKKASTSNVFSGTTNCPMILGGLYNEDKSSKYDIYSATVIGYGYKPITSEYIDEIQGYIDEMIGKGKINLSNYKIIQANPTIINPALGGIASFYDDDFIILDYSEDYDSKYQIAESIVMQKDMGYKKYKQYYYDYLDSIE